jgi:hypothetical protein
MTKRDTGPHRASSGLIGPETDCDTGSGSVPYKGTDRTGPSVGRKWRDSATASEAGPAESAVTPPSRPACCAVC